MRRLTTEYTEHTKKMERISGKGIIEITNLARATSFHADHSFFILGFLRVLRALRGEKQIALNWNAL
jgi:hypothetical protein